MDVVNYSSDLSLPDKRPRKDSSDLSSSDLSLPDKRPRKDSSDLSLPDKRPRKDSSDLSLPDKSPRKHSSDLSLPDKSPRKHSSDLSLPDKRPRILCESETEINHPTMIEGQLLEIYLENFMNHKNCQLKLGPNLNFITGHNGSGKSAFTIGLQICLGAKSERSSRLSGLIREGSTGPAKVRVTFSNNGSDAYFPEIYGKSLSIERRIYSSGPSQYFILSHTRKVISNEKSVVVDICRQFAIYSNNPCVILTQEYSKILMKSSPSEKFAFLLKACGSESVKESLDKGVINVNAMKERIKAVEYDRNRFISKLDLLKTHATKYQMIDSTCSQINLLKLKRVWVPYHTCRLAVREIETELSVLQNQESSLHRNLSEMMKEHPLSSIKPAPTTENHLSSLREELVFENQRFYDTKKRHSGLLEEIRCLQEEKNELLKNYTQIETLIVSSKDIGKEGTKNLTQQLKQVEESIGSTQIQLAKLIEKEESEKVELATIQNLHREMVESLKSSETSLRKHLEDQSRYTSSTRNRGELYFPSKFNSLVESIRSETFIRKVKGPIGLFLKIDPRYSEYAKAIETAIGQNILKSFLVECIEDQRKMSKLLKAYNLDYTVKVHCIDEPKAKKHDCTPEIKFLTVMNALIVDDIDIFNMLLDQYNLDRLALFPSEEQMHSTIVSETNGRKHFTGKISKAFFLNGASYVYKDGNTGSFSSQGNFKGLIASSDTSAILDEMKKNIYSKESMVKQIKEEERSLFQQCNDLRQCLYQKSEAKKQFSTKLRNLDSKLSSLREEIQDNENINPNPNEDLKKDLQVLESHRNDLDELLHEKERIQEKLKKDLVVIQEKKLALQEKVSFLENALEREQEEKYTEEKIRSEQERQLSLFQENIASIQEEIASVTRRLDTEQQRLVNLKILAMQEALEFTKGENEVVEIEEEETLSFLSKKIAIFENKLKAYTTSCHSSSWQQYNEKIQRLQEKIKDLEIALNGLKNLERDLEEDYLNRRSTWKKTYMKYFKHIDKAFREFLKEKEDFDGFIQIDPEAEKLYLQLNLKFKDDNENLNIIKDIATSQTAGEMLSGGQRCLVNVFFLLSLFSVTETPFRVLDEVDVFMDQTMRTKYLEVLEEFTLDPYYENRQMIIITPQSLEGVITNDRVQIHRIR